MRKVNLYTEYQTKYKQIKLLSPKYLGLIITSLTILIVLLLSVVVRIEHSKLLEDDAQYQSYLTNKHNIDSFNTYLKDMERLELQKNVNEKIDVVNGVLSKKGKIDSSILQALDNSLPTNVTIKRISLNQESIQIDFKSASIYGPSLLASNLSYQDVFASVEYSGYKLVESKSNEEGELSQKSYEGSLILFLKGGY